MIMKLTLSIQGSCKNHVIQAYYQKIDFIEKTCPICHMFENLNLIAQHQDSVK